jgi:hypothetical protein
MVDLVGTCPMDFWKEWIAEGDAAGLPESGLEKRWWLCEDERPFPDWQTEGVDVKKPRAPKPTRQFTVTAPSPGTPYRESNT